MAKILVADDNSNIQKMVGLALKDQGIDVVAVGNGEAAVRKISDVRPDLVLADVFMPVRNGYEVCKYVKEDSALAHIPVILLVGAFDPLDEQEAQRVGADGVLKKPFVPPDPLISMVKSALTRAGVSYSGAPHGHEDSQPPLRGTDLLTPPHKPAVPPPPMPFQEPEPFHEPVSKKPEPFTIDSNAQPLAFGSLLESQETHEEQEDTGYVTPLDPKLVPERSWGAEDAEAEEQAEDVEETQNGWRPLGGGGDLDDVPAGRKDWREKAFDTLESIKRNSGKWTPTREKTDLTEVSSQEPAASTLAEVSAQVVSTTSEPRAGTTSKGKESEEKVVQFAETESLITETPLAPPPSEPLPQTESHVSAIPSTPTAPPAAPGWFSVPSSPWDAEVQKATQLATTWDAVPSTPAVTEAPPETSSPAAEVDQEEVAPSNELAPVPETAWPAPSEEVIREETAQVVEETIQEAAPTDTAVADASTANPNLDDVVAKVLAKMSPEVLQAVTKEILKPVVEALVRDELGKK